MRRAIVLSLVLATLPACSGRTPLTPAVDASGAHSPADVDRLFGERLNAGDIDGLLALYEPGATLIRGNRTSATGHPAIRTEIAGIVALKPRIVMNVKTVLRGGRNIAVLYNDWHATGTGQDGKPISVSGRASEVVRQQQDGTWRFVIDDPDARGQPRDQH